MTRAATLPITSLERPVRPSVPRTTIVAFVSPASSETPVCAGTPSRRAPARLHAGRDRPGGELVEAVGAPAAHGVFRLLGLRRKLRQHGREVKDVRDDQVGPEPLRKPDRLVEGLPGKVREVRSEQNRVRHVSPPLPAQRRRWGPPPAPDLPEAWCTGDLSIKCRAVHGGMATKRGSRADGSPFPVGGYCEERVYSSSWNFTSFVSCRKSMPMTTVMRATTIGYQRPK